MILTMLQSPAGFDFPVVTALVAFGALPVKFLVDVVKDAIPRLPGAFLPPIGLAIGFVFSILVLIAAETPFKASIYAQCAIAAVGAQIAAMAVTWNQNRANRVDERIQMALDSAPGTTRAEVDAAVKEKT